MNAFAGKSPASSSSSSSSSSPSSSPLLNSFGKRPPRHFQPATSSDPTHVPLNDDKLYAIAFAARPRVVKGLRANVRNARLWKLRSLKKSVLVYETKRSNSADAFATLAITRLTCSLEEALAIVHSRDDRTFNAAMRGLYDRDFLFGSVVHTAEDAPILRRGEHATRLAASLTVKPWAASSTSCVPA